MNECMILLLGESGSGKTSAEAVLHKKYGLIPLRSYTTRARRDAEDTDHIFISEERFSGIENLVAYAEYDGARYGATREQIDHCDTYVVDPSGYQLLLREYKGNKIFIPIYLDADRETREFRMRQRGDRPETIRERLKHDKKVFHKFRKQVYAKSLDVIPLDANEKTAEQIADDIYEVLCALREC